MPHWTTLELCGFHWPKPFNVKAKGLFIYFSIMIEKPQGTAHHVLHTGGKSSLKSTAERILGCLSSGLLTGCWPCRGWAWALTGQPKRPRPEPLVCSMLIHHLAFPSSSSSLKAHVSAASPGLSQLSHGVYGPELHSSPLGLKASLPHLSIGPVEFCGSTSFDKWK